MGPNLTVVFVLSVVIPSFVSAQCISVVFAPCPEGLKINFCMTSVHNILLSSLFFNPGHLCAVCVELCQIEKFLQTT